MAPRKPIVIKIPPGTASSAGKGNAWDQFVNYWAAHGYKALKENSASILAAAKAEHIDPVTFGALVLNESGGNFNIADSNTGAIGIGQLEPGTFIGPNAFNGGVLPWNNHHQITAADLRDPGINLRLAAAYYGYLQGQYPADPYGRYNAGPHTSDAAAGQIQAAFTQKWITKWNPKYVSTVPSTAPPAPAGQQVPGGTAPPHQDINFKDPYIAGVTKQAKFSTTNDPNKALQYDGAPLTRSSFLTLRDQLTSHFVSYTGKRPSIKQVETFIQKGWSTYNLDVVLSHSPNFTKSPLYKQNGVPLQDAVKDLLPQGAKVPPELMRQAIVNQWSATTLADQLRKLPTYVKSNDFKGNLATLTNVHDSIMGNATQADLKSISDAALAGWSSDQYAQYLRSSKNYTQSTEYQSKALTLVSSLGLLTGAQAVIKQGVSPGPGYVAPPEEGKIPSGPRVKGNPNNTPAPLPGLGVTLN